MIALRTSLRQEDLPDDLDRYLRRLERVVPAGPGRRHARPSPDAERWMAEHPPTVALSTQQERTALTQFGTLGGGNHFFEVAVDEVGLAWLVLHSGSRGIGNQLAQAHIDRAKRLARHSGTPLEDPDLAYFLEGTREFDEYIRAMLWAQAYAMGNRHAMMDAASRELFASAGSGEETERINCHHNFAARELHDGRWLWITRKGAIRAERGDRGVVPGSMGARTFVVRGRGEPLSWRSCAHGAGRLLSRRAARRQITVEDFARAMEGRVWLRDRAERLLDEAPTAYKDIDQVMRDQADLVEVEHELRGLVNYKGV